MSPNFLTSLSLATWIIISLASVALIVILGNAIRQTWKSFSENIQVIFIAVVAWGFLSLLGLLFEKNVSGVPIDIYAIAIVGIIIGLCIAPIIGWCVRKKGVMHAIGCGIFTVITGPCITIIAVAALIVMVSD